MIDVFEKFAPQYARVLRKFALEVWYDRADINALYRSANHFRKRYEDELMAMFRRRKLDFSPKRVQEISGLWLADQITTGEKIFEVADLKKKKLYEEIISTEREYREQIRGLFDQPKTEKGLAKVLPDTSFSGNLSRRSLQIGEDAAFELGRDINHDVVSANSDVYEWMTQGDSRVRRTHQKLQGKIFTYTSPPTTIDKYGHRHTGNPGTDWGCRCWEKEVKGKPILNYVARA